MTRTLKNPATLQSFANTFLPHHDHGLGTLQLYQSFTRQGPPVISLMGVSLEEGSYPLG